MSSLYTNVPGSSPAMIRVNTEAIATTVQRMLVLSQCERQSDKHVVGHAEYSEFHHLGSSVRSTAVLVFALR